MRRVDWREDAPRAAAWQLAAQMELPDREVEMASFFILSSHITLLEIRNIEKKCLLPCVTWNERHFFPRRRSATVAKENSTTQRKQPTSVGTIIHSVRFI